MTSDEVLEQAEKEYGFMSAAQQYAREAHILTLENDEIHLVWEHMVSAGWQKILRLLSTSPQEYFHISQGIPTSPRLQALVRLHELAGYYRTIEYYRVQYLAAQQKEQADASGTYGTTSAADAL